jgi:hypothetical protein
MSRRAHAPRPAALASLALEVLLALIQTGSPFDMRNIARAMDEVRRRSGSRGRRR